jgi:hypothetical protein
MICGRERAIVLDASQLLECERRDMNDNGDHCEASGLFSGRWCLSCTARNMLETALRASGGDQ